MNIAPAHLERMGSLLGVADTKAAIYDALPAQGVAVINADDAFAPFFEQRVFADRAQGRRILRFGLDASAEVTARDIVANADGSEFTLATPAGETRIELALPGPPQRAQCARRAAMALARAWGWTRSAPGSAKRARSPAGSCATASATARC